MPARRDHLGQDRPGAQLLGQDDFHECAEVQVVVATSRQLAVVDVNLGRKTNVLRANLVGGIGILVAQAGWS